MKPYMSSVVLPLLTILCSFCSTRASAHGESVRGVGGAGINTTGGEVTAGAAAYVRYDLRSYSLFSDDALREFQAAGENVHQHSREHTVFMGATYGVEDTWDLSVLLQANRFEAFTDNGDAYALSTGQLSRTDVSQGLGDMLILGRYQFFHADEQHFSAIGGLKLPTGDIRRRTNQGDLVGTHNQPGSGSVDFQLGAAYAGQASRRLQVAADLLARINTEGAGSFRSGNSVQADLAVSTRVSFLTPSLELNALVQQQDIEQDAVKKNSGVLSLFLTPAVRASFRGHGVFAAVSIPLVQAFAPGVISNIERVRLSVGYGVSWGAPEDRRDDTGMPPPPPVASGSF